MLNIGAKIKQLRKERKMTLAQVAGDRITKGMLSLIENGKAQPSMESLQHIAKQLEIDVAELMQSGESEEIHQLFLQVEKLLTELKKQYDKTHYIKQCQELHDLIQPYIKSGQIKGNTYEEVRLTEIYLVMRYRLKLDTRAEPFFDLVKMYENVHAYSKIVNIYGRMCGINFEQRKFEVALGHLLEGEKYIERYGELIDDLQKLDLYYNLTVVHAALNNQQQAEHYTKIALKMAKEKKILYRINDFYRFLFFISVTNEEAEKATYYLKKINAFTEILEEPIETVVEQILTLIYTNYIEQDYEKTIATKLEKLALPEDVYEDVAVFINGEYAYAYLQLNRTAEALNLLKTIVVPEHNHHPIDVIRIYRAFAIRALCYFEQGDIHNAKRDILYAVDGIKEFIETLDTKFIVDAYDKIMNK